MYTGLVMKIRLSGVNIDKENPFCLSLPNYFLFSDMREESLDRVHDCCWVPNPVFSVFYRKCFISFFTIKGLKYQN